MTVSIETVLPHPCELRCAVVAQSRSETAENGREGTCLGHWIPWPRAPEHPPASPRARPTHYLSSVLPSRHVPRSGGLLPSGGARPQEGAPLLTREDRGGCDHAARGTEAGHSVVLLPALLDPWTPWQTWGGC